jgi:hypothetical protein
MWFLRRTSSLSLAAPLLAVLGLGALPASAIGFGVGVEAGGHVGMARIASGGITEPGLFGGGGALVLSTEFLDEGLFSVQGIGRLEGHGFAIVAPAGGGAGGGGGGDLLLRIGLRTPLLTPFLELGGGTAVGGGGGTADLSGVGQAVDEAVGGVMWAPAGYVGVGSTLALPLLPYFEFRLGSHIGGLMPLDGAPPLTFAGNDMLSTRFEVYLGTGLRI